MFKKAQKQFIKLRMAIIGASGCGKTYTALKIAKGLGGKIAVIDTEHGSAAKYADIVDFDIAELHDFNPENYIKAIQAAEKAGYDVLIIDSLSHAWAGSGGALELADKNAIKYGGNRFTAWRDVTPLHNRLVEAILQADMHVIAAMRAKTEYVIEQESGKTKIHKVGLAPIQRDGIEYEFDIVADMDLDHNLIITKTRFSILDGLVINRPDETLGEQLKAWITDDSLLINEQQAKRLYELVDKNADKLKELINKYGYQSTREIKIGDYEKMLRELKK